MEPGKLTELPLAFQLVAAAGLFVGTFTLAIGGWLWKHIKPKLPAALQPPEQQKDAVVLSAAIADSQSINKLAHAIERLIEVMEDSGEDTERALDRNYKRLGDLNDNAERVYEVVCRLERHMKDRTIV